MLFLKDCLIFQKLKFQTLGLPKDIEIEDHLPLQENSILNLCLKYAFKFSYVSGNICILIITVYHRSESEIFKCM